MYIRKKVAGYYENLDKTNQTINIGATELFLFSCFVRSECDSLPQLKEALDKSSQSNITVLHKDGWKWHDWKKFLERYFKRFQSIRQYDHFRYALII